LKTFEALLSANVQLISKQMGVSTLKTVESRCANL